jgi:hypothetical protein
MTPISIARIALPFFVLTAASGAALVFGILYGTQPSVETRAATTAAAVAPTADVGDEGSAALAKALPPTVSPGSPDIGDVIMPAFDFALALTTSDKASVIPAKSVVVPSIVRHPSRARHEAKGPAAQDVSGLRPKLFNHVLGSHQ